MELSECKIGTKVRIRSIKDLVNEFGGDDHYIKCRYNYNSEMSKCISHGAVGVIANIKDYTDLPIQVKSEAYKMYDYTGYQYGWWHHPETLYEIKEDTENE